MTIICTPKTLLLITVIALLLAAVGGFIVYSIYYIVIALYNPAQVLFSFFFFLFGPSYTFVLCRRLRHVVCREGLLSSTSDSIVNLANGGFACDTSLPHYWRMLVIFCVSPCDSIISSSGSVIGNRALCAGSVAGQHCCSSMGLLCRFCGEVCIAFVCVFYFFWLSASHDLRLGMDGMLLALCDHGFERSG